MKSSGSLGCLGHDLLVCFIPVSDAGLSVKFVLGASSKSRIQLLLLAQTLFPKTGGSSAILRLSMMATCKVSSLSTMRNEANKSILLLINVEPMVNVDERAQHIC